MRLTVVGCSGSMASSESAASCYLVQAEGPASDGGSRTWSILLDLGTGAMGPLQGYLDPGTVDAVALSHLHADHTADLSALAVWLKYHPSSPYPITDIVGPAGTEQHLRTLMLAPAEDDLHCARFSDWNPSRGVPIGPFTLTPYPVRHPIPAFGIRVEGPSEVPHRGRVSLAYTGDTDACEGAEELAAGSDLLLAEAAFQEGRDDVRGLHLTGRRAGELAAGRTDRLVLTHLQPWTDPAISLREAREVFDGEVEIARPGATWSL